MFHDDQHGTAIVVGAAVLNGLHLIGKKLDEVKLVTSGAGAAALACLDLLVNLGVKVENIWVTDIKGVAYEGRIEDMDPIKARYAKQTDMRTLGEVIAGADVFLGLSAGGVLKKEMVAKMAAKPLILPLANPTPVILPEEVQAVRDDAIMATGRTDYPNQVNNVLCFPFIFPGALDVGATTITKEMEIAAVQAIARLAQEESSEEVASASRSFWKSRLVAFALTVAGGALALVSMSLTLVVRGFGRDFSLVVAYAAKAAALGLSWTLFLLIYRLASDAGADLRVASRAALWAAVAWEASRYAFVWNLGRLQLATVYGPLTFAVSLVLWAYVSSLVLVFGAAMAPVGAGRGR